MKKSHIVIGMLTALGVVTASSSFAQAAGGVITFEGQLTDTTCNVDGAADGAKTVKLPIVKTSLLSTAGSVAGGTLFDIKVKDCPVGITKVATHFAADAHMDSSTQDLKQQFIAAIDKPAADNVQVRVKRVGGTTSIVGHTDNVGFDVTNGNAAGNGTATMTYAAEYRSNDGGATAGYVMAKVNYVLAYP